MAKGFVFTLSEEIHCCQGCPQLSVSSYDTEIKAVSHFLGIDLGWKIKTLVAMFLGLRLTGYNSWRGIICHKDWNSEHYKIFLHGQSDIYINTIQHSQLSLVWLWKKTLYCTCTYMYIGEELVPERKTTKDKKKNDSGLSEKCYCYKHWQQEQLAKLSNRGEIEGELKEKVQ